WTRSLAHSLVAALTVCGIVAGGQRLQGGLIEDSYLAAAYLNPTFRAPLLQILVDSLTREPEEAPHFLLGNQKLDAAWRVTSVEPGKTQQSPGEPRRHR